MNVTIEVLIVLNAGSIGAMLWAVYRIGRVLERFDLHGRMLDDHEKRLRAVEGRKA